MHAGAVIFAPMEKRNDIVIYQSEDGLVKMEAMVDPAGETIWANGVLKQYTLKGYAVNQNAVASQKYEDLKRAMGLCGTDPDDCRKSHRGDGHDGEGGGEPD